MILKTANVPAATRLRATEDTAHMDTLLATAYLLPPGHAKSVRRAMNVVESPSADIRATFAYVILTCAITAGLVIPVIQTQQLYSLQQLLHIFVFVIFFHFYFFSSL